jgi:hypothetical protein
MSARVLRYALWVAAYWVLFAFGHLRLVARELAFQLSSNSVSDHCVPFPTLGETDVASSRRFPDGAPNNISNRPAR